MEGRVITRRREALRMTGRALAREVGVSPSTLLRWERGVVQIGPAMARLVELTLSRLERDQARRATRRAAYARRKSAANVDTLELAANAPATVGAARGRGRPTALREWSTWQVYR